MLLHLPIPSARIEPLRACSSPSAILGPPARAARRL
jgi:hypothetical protein